MHKSTLTIHNNVGDVGKSYVEVIKGFGGTRIATADDVILQQGEIKGGTSCSQFNFDTQPNPPILNCPRMSQLYSNKASDRVN